LQIWIRPDKKGAPPRHEDTSFPVKDKRGELVLIASPDARDGSLAIHQDVNAYASILDAGRRLDYRLRPDRHAWIQVARGRLRVNGHDLRQGDGASISEESRLELEGIEETEFLLFDLA
jgi:redox-sensitive bicupin YhaK (pirin superfamily)